METRGRHMKRVTQQDGNKDRKRVIERRKSSRERRARKPTKVCICKRKAETETKNVNVRGGSR